MEEAKERFAQYLSRSCGDRSTPKHYLSDIGMFIEYVGAKPAREVSRQDVDEFVAAQVARGLSPSTVNRRLASLHTFFEYLASEEPDEIWPNPVHWRRHKVKEPERLPRDVSDADVERLFAVIDKARDRALFGLMVGAGLRVGEVVALGCGDLEPLPDGVQCARLRVCGKGQKERIVFVTLRWYALVAAWLAVRPEADTDHLFLNQHGAPLSVAGVQYCLRQYSEQAGLSVSCHQLRHTYARRLAEQEMPIESIAKLLGHAQVETTQRYTQGADAPLRRAFLAAMQGVEQGAPALAPNIVPPSPPQRGREERDSQGLEQALARFGSLPAWLQPTLAAHVRRRWRDWQPPLATEHAHRLCRQLVRIWGWLLTTHPLPTWSDVQRSHLESWLQARTEAGIAVSTRRHELSQLLASLRFAQEQGLPVSPHLFRIAFPAPSQPLPRSLTVADYQRLVQTVSAATSSANQRDILDRTWFLTLIQTGLRLAELLNLRLSDLDFASARLFVRSGKKGRERVVYLSDTLIQALADYLTVRPPGTDDHLWMEGETPLTANQVRYRLRGWGRRADGAVSPHRLRHTFATLLINQGLSLDALSKLLGHRSLSMTQHYARLSERTVQQQFQSAVEQIEGIAVTDWPQTSPIPVENGQSIEHSSDSV